MIVSKSGPGHALRQVALLLSPEFSNLGLAVIIETLFVANWLAQRPLFEWRTVSIDGQPVRASNGMQAAVQGDLGTAEACASVFVLASFEPLRSARHRPLLRWLQRAARAGVELAGIENGSLALAQAGLLDEHPAAVHWDNLAGFQELFPKVRIARASFSMTRNRITCAGAAAIFELMSAWLALHADVQLAQEVARHLLLQGGRMPAREAARTDEAVQHARALMQAHIDEPLPCAVLAHRLGLSLRQLERRFQEALGRTVHAEYRLVRVERAHQYLQQTELSVGDVAALTGFSSAEYFAKVYRRAFATRPSGDRRQATDAPVFRRAPQRGARRGGRGSRHAATRAKSTDGPAD